MAKVNTQCVTTIDYLVCVTHVLCIYHPDSLTLMDIDGLVFICCSQSYWTTCPRQSDLNELTLMQILCINCVICNCAFILFKNEENKQKEKKQKKMYGTVADG